MSTDIPLDVTIETLQVEVEALKRQSADYLEGWQRAKADFINARKEEEKQRGELLTYATQGLMRDMIGVLDSFNLAMSNKEMWERVDIGWRTGVEYIYQQLVGILKDRGMLEVGQVGDPLDLSLHQPMGERETDEITQAETISEVIQKGYKIGERIVRPAHVLVYKFSRN